MKRSHKPLWTCRECGHRFVTRNIWHSCSNYRLDHHFKGRDPVVRKVFDKYVSLAKKCGPVTVYAQKTRIVFMVRMRFAGGHTARQWLNATLLLERRARHPHLRKIEYFPPRYFVHHFRLTGLSDIDRPMAALMREAYVLGCQEQYNRAPSVKSKKGGKS